MKLTRFGASGQEKPGVFDANGTLRDLSAHVTDIDADLLADLSVLDGIDLSALPAVDGNPRLGPCVTGTSKFICIGLNYSDHAAETNNPIPSEPVIFMKATSTIVGPNDDVIIRAARKRPTGRSNSA